jgi:cytoskeletal protein CcmA (bactofilin family)
MMSMLKSSKSSPRPPSSGAVDTLVGRQTELHGDVRFSGGLHIDGTIKGNVTSVGSGDAVLSVSESGSIEGDVKVANVVLNGTILGDVHATERLTLSSKARVTGNVHYKVMEMASGATVNGQMVHEAGGVSGAARATSVTDFPTKSGSEDSGGWSAEAGKTGQM